MGIFEENNNEEVASDPVGGGSISVAPERISRGSLTGEQIKILSPICGRWPFPLDITVFGLAYWALWCYFDIRIVLLGGSSLQ